MDKQDIGWRTAAGADEDFGSKVGHSYDSLWLIVAHNPTPSPTQHNPHGPDDPFRTINYLHLDISGHDGMDKQDIGWKTGWCADEDFGLEVGQMQLMADCC
jgi:hypothetical protein